MTAATEGLLLLIVNEPAPRAVALGRAAARLGHRVAAERHEDLHESFPDVVVVGCGEREEFALELIAQISRRREAAVIASAPAPDPAYAEAAAVRGAYAVIGSLAISELASAISIARHRFDDYRRLIEAFERRATIEQAKGILMARQSVSSDQAFALLRRHSQRSNRKLVEVAEAIRRSHGLLVAATRFEGVQM